MNEIEFPPREPHDETAIPHIGSEFLECSTALDEFVARMKLNLISTTYHSSGVWGYVLRANVSATEGTSGIQHRFRLIIWKGVGGVGVLSDHSEV
jgi:hypothetical protein